MGGGHGRPHQPHHTYYIYPIQMVHHVDTFGISTMISHFTTRREGEKKRSLGRRANNKNTETLYFKQIVLQAVYCGVCGRNLFIVFIFLLCFILIWNRHILMCKCNGSSYEWIGAHFRPWQGGRQGGMECERRTKVYYVLLKIENRDIALVAAVLSRKNLIE